MIGAADIARALNGRKSGAGWICKCVAHDDRNPSLSIGQGADGQILVRCHAGCDSRDVIDALRGRGLWPEERDISNSGSGKANKPKPAARLESNTTNGKALQDNRVKVSSASQIWRESVDPRGTWAEDYLSARGLRLPADPEILLRTLRFHPACPFPDRTKAPALIAAFTPILAEVPDDPFLDPPPAAIHRIRGRGAGNKFMLGPVKGCAVMISPWWHVHETLHVCEGVETALALYDEAAKDHRTSADLDADDWQFDDKAHRPIWALGSAGAIRTLPVVSRVKRLVVWADNDESGVGLAAALEAGRRWQEAGKQVVIRRRNAPGADHADR